MSTPAQPHTGAAAGAPQPSPMARGTLTAQIIGWSFVPTAIILLAVALVVFYSYQRVTGDLAIEQNRELARLSASELASELTEYTSNLGQLGRSMGAAWGRPAEMDAALEAARNRLVVFDAGVVLLDHYGRVVTALPPRPEIIGQDWSAHSYFRSQIRRLSPAFSNVEADGPGGRPAVVVAVPVTTVRGEMLGQALGMFNIDAAANNPLYGGIVKLRIAPGTTMYLVDQSGKVIYHSDAAQIGSSLSGQQAVAEVIAGRTGAFRTRDVAGKEILAAFAPVPGTPWGLVTETRWDALLAPSRGYSRFLTLLLVLGILVPALVTFAGVRRINKTINRLTDAAREIADGQFGQTIPAASSVELEELVGQFNRMSVQLSETYDRLSRQNEQLTLVMRGTNDGIWDWDIRSGAVYFSPRWKGMLGYEDAEIPNLFEEWLRLMHPDDVARVQDTLDTYLAGRLPIYQVEHRLRHKDGNYRWILARGLALMGTDGKAYRMAGSHTDITEPRRARNLLDGQRGFLEMLATGETLPETLDALVRVLEEEWPGMYGLVLLLDDEKRHLYVGAYASLPVEYVDALDGLEAAAFLGAPSESAFEGQSVIVEDIAADPRWGGLAEHALKFGLRSCWCEPVFSSAGEVIGAFSMYHRAPGLPSPLELQTLETSAHLVGVAIEHKRAEQELRRSEARFRTVFESAAIGMAIADAGGSLLETNPAIQDILGYTTDELRHMPASLYLDPEDPTLTPEFDAVRSGERGRLQIERRFIHKDGHTVWGRLTYSLARDERGGSLYRIGMIEDITERRRAQLALETAYQTLERRVAERTKELSAINAISMVVSRSLDLHEILGGALDEVMQVSRADSGSMFTFDAPANTFQLVADRNLSLKFTQLVSLLPYDVAVAGREFAPGALLTWSAEDFPDGEIRAGIVAEGICTIAAVPLTAKGRLNGALVLAFDSVRSVSPEEGALLATVGGQIGVAIENASLYEAEQARHEEAERRREVAEGMSDVIEVLNSRQSLQETLEFIAGQACRLMGCDGAAIMVLHKAEQLLTVQASCGLPQEFHDRLRFQVGEAAAGKALLDRAPVVIPDTQRLLADMIARNAIPGGMSKELVQSMAESFRVLVSVPLMVRDAPYGAISLYYQEPREIQPEEVRLAQSIANQAALAIESTELRDQAEQSATVAERNRLARELHDSVTQNLYSVTLYAEAAARLLENGSSGQAASYLRDLRDTAQEALREMRLLIFELRPPELEKTGLAAAIQMRLQSVEARGGMQAGLNLEGVENEARVPLAVQQELYQITQEALNNTLKHSKATRVVVTLTYGESGVWLEVADDGAGFDAGELQGGVGAYPALGGTGAHSTLGGMGVHSTLGGMGLGNMRERAARIGARLTIDSAPGRGTRVTVTRPANGAVNSH